MLGGLLALAAASIGSALIGGIISKKQNDANIDYQNEANQQNIDLQKETNAQNQYNMEHAHQIEMKDLEAAGLNPVLTATGGQGAPLANISAPSVKAPQADYSGVSSAISSAINSMTMLTMANAMAKNNAALLQTREAGKQSRLNQVLAARAARDHAVSSPRDYKNVARAVKRAVHDYPISDKEWFDIFE